MFFLFCPDLSRIAYEELLMVLAANDRKVEREQSSGGNYTTSVEAPISGSERGIQNATIHLQGQSYSEKFTFEDSNTQVKQNVEYRLVCVEHDLLQGSASFNENKVRRFIIGDKMGLKYGSPALRASEAAFNITTQPTLLPGTLKIESLKIFTR